MPFLTEMTKAALLTTESGLHCVYGSRFGLLYGNLVDAALVASAFVFG